MLASPGSYFFLSNSAGQGDEWLKSLNKGIWIPFTGTRFSTEVGSIVDLKYGLHGTQPLFYTTTAQVSGVCVGR